MVGYEEQRNNFGEVFTVMPRKTVAFIARMKCLTFFVVIRMESKTHVRVFSHLLVN